MPLNAQYFCALSGNRLECCGSDPQELLPHVVVVMRVCIGDGGFMSVIYPAMCGGVRGFMGFY